MSRTDLGTDAYPYVGEMPMLGIGTWQNTDPEACRTAVETALEMGYRHVDTAQAYGNEEFVGDGLAAADVDREDVFLATKVFSNLSDRGSILDSVEASLDRLGVDYLDLLYVHWPHPGATPDPYDPGEVFGAFDDLYDRGTVDRVGVSNFEPEMVEEAVEVADAPIFANQVELHPLLQQRELREHSPDLGVELVAYSPLARGGVFDVPELAAIADAHGVSEAQVSLAWIREKGITAIPKATSGDHIRDNWESLSVDLDDEEVARIDAIDREDRRVNPGWHPQW
jgi:2,5-diketo-D-gluconate reductase B